MKAITKTILLCVLSTPSWAKPCPENSKKSAIDILMQLHSMEVAYLIENDRYTGELSDLNWDCDEPEVVLSADPQGRHYLARVNRRSASGHVTDTWTVNEKKDITHEGDEASEHFNFARRKKNQRALSR